MIKLTKLKSKMLIPALKKGDTIAVFNVSDKPAKITNQELANGVNFLTEMGFKVKIFKGSFNRKKDITATIKQFNEIFKDNSIKGIIFSSGGTKAVQFLEGLNYEIIRKNPKFIMGFSDCTHVIQAITHKCNFITFHGPVIRTINKWPKKIKNLFIDFVVNKKDISYPLDKGSFILRPGQIKGEVFAGNDICNLATIMTLKIKNFQNKILFIENHSDQNAEMVEYWFSLYAALGILNQIKGVIFGNYVLKNKKNTLKKLYDLYLSHLKIPVACVDFFGDGKNYFIPNGSKALIDLKNKKIEFYH